jgi:hypothetical protein
VTRSFTLASALLWLCWAGLASAQQEPASAEEAEAEPESLTEHWSGAPSRLFVAGVADLGLQTRARLVLGYGKPHWTWLGLEGEAATGSEAGFGVARARIALLIADVAVAYRRTWAYRHSYLDRERGYSDADLLGGPKAAYHSLDLSAMGLLPVGGGVIDWQFEAVRVYGLEPGVDLYEEWLRVPMRPPWATACRLGYAHMFLDQRLAVGALAEWLWPGPTGSLFRVGPLVNWAFGPHWDLSLLLTAVVHGPDSLNFYNGMWGTLRARYKFATGEKLPHEKVGSGRFQR